MQSSIRLQQMEFYAYHGVFPQERQVGARFLVDVSFHTSFQAALHSDRVEDTVDYSAVYALVKAEMHIPSRLIEHLCGRIHSRIKQVFPGITQLQVTVTKPAPPLGGQLAGVQVTLAD